MIAVASHKKTLFTPFFSRNTILFKFLLTLWITCSHLKDVLEFKVSVSGKKKSIYNFSVTYQDRDYFKSVYSFSRYI